MGKECGLHSGQQARCVDRGPCGWGAAGTQFCGNQPASLETPQPTSVHPPTRLSEHALKAETEEGRAPGGLSTTLLHPPPPCCQEGLLHNVISHAGCKPWVCLVCVHFLHPRCNAPVFSVLPSVSTLCPP